ncbi:MAG: hypothetical protein ACQETB_03640 [Halobacteriota archaeon]
MAGRTGTDSDRPFDEWVLTATASADQLRGPLAFFGGTAYALSVLAIGALTGSFDVNVGATTAADGVFGALGLIAAWAPIVSLGVASGGSIYAFGRYGLAAPATALLVGTPIGFSMQTSPEVNLGVTLAAPVLLLAVAFAEWYVRVGRARPARDPLTVGTLCSVVYTGFFTVFTLGPTAIDPTPWLFQPSPTAIALAVWFVFGLHLAVIAIPIALALSRRLLVPGLLGLCAVLVDLRFVQPLVGSGDFAVLLYVLLGPIVAGVVLASGLLERRIRPIDSRGV